jgi:BirA family transcriptional regulator, biotin operon repressor / biotin---[acetyl-CoA-carboxylase] ligase
VSLSPARIVAALPAYHVVRLTEVDSTNDELKRRIAAGCPAGTVVVAGTQSAGRGRRGRTWQSPAGNLYASLLLRPGCGIVRALELVFVAGLAVADAVEGRAKGAAGQGAAVRCKWPNDVLLDGRKIAGILVESQADADGGLDWLVVGIGVNVMSHPDDASSLYPATSLADAGVCGENAPAVLDAVLAAFAGWYERWRLDGFAGVRRAWLEQAFGLGEPIDVRLEQQTLSGTFEGIDESGQLLLATASGVRPVSTGDVFPTRHQSSMRQTGDKRANGADDASRH